MLRGILGVLGAGLIVCGVFPSDVPHPNGHVFYLGWAGSPLLRSETIEEHRVEASGSTYHNLSHSWAIEFLSVSMGLVAAGVGLIVLAARTRRVASSDSGAAP